MDLKWSFLFLFKTEHLFVYNGVEVSNMAIQDRGKKKWQFAFGMPELIKSQRNLWIDQKRMKRPIIDEYVKEEFDLRICYAMEYNLPVKVTIWTDGFLSEITGQIHYLDPITHQLRIELQRGDFRRVDFGDVIDLSVVD